MPPRAVHADAQPEAELPIERAALAQAGAELLCAAASNAEELREAAREADVLLAELSPVPRQVIEGLDRCLAIVTYSIGVDHIDLEAATARGILVVNLPGFCTEDVALHTIMFILACGKKLMRFDRYLRSGRWPDYREWGTLIGPLGSVYGQRLGLIGFGSIARSVARAARALGMQVAAHDPLVPTSVVEAHAVAPAALDSLIEQSDYLSLHTPLLPETHHLIGETRLRQMKPTAFLINTSRGAVVDQAALVRALQEGWIAGAALDVFESEPLAADSPLLAMDNVVVTPHSAGASEAAFAVMRQRVGDEAARVVRGEWPTAIANPAVKGHSRLEQRMNPAQG